MYPGLIENRQHLVDPAIAELVVYEVDGPDVVPMGARRGVLANFAL